MQNINPSDVYKHEIQSLDENEVRNNAGGRAYLSDKWEKLDRYLIIGAESGTYYVNPKKNTTENLKNVLACIKEDGKRVVDRTIEVSDEALAPKNDQAIFVMALCMAEGDTATKTYARENLDKVVRTASHLTMFVERVAKLRGWGRSLKKAVSSWYNNIGKKTKNSTSDEDEDRNVSALAYQLMKYSNRNGYTQRDIMRLCHVKPENPYQATLYQWVTKPEIIPALPSEDNENKLKAAHEELFKYAAAKQLNKYDVSQVIDLVLKYRLPHEVIPTELRNNKDVWQALLDAGMPLNALIRNLGKLQQLNLIEPLSDNEAKIRSILTNEEYIKASRIHPVNVLNQKKGYSQGSGRSGISWQPNERIVSALEDMFYLSFKNVVPSGKKMMLALDVSGSMSWGIVPGMTLSAAEISVAMAMVTARVESNYMITAFSTNLIDVPINEKMFLDDIMRITRDITFGGTDCALPMIEAKRRRLDVDMFVLYTDNETWYNDSSPAKALREYRDFEGKEYTRAAFVACTASDFTLSDPNDRLSLDIAGFSPAVPQVLSYFASI